MKEVSASNQRKKRSSLSRSFILLSLPTMKDSTHLGRRMRHVDLAEDGIAVVGEHDACVVCRGG